MGRDAPAYKLNTSLCLTPGEFFVELVSEAFAKRKIQTLPEAKFYLVDLLKHYMATSNLYDETANGKRSQKMLAETLLRACNSEPRQKIEMLKKLGDSALYISGFFGDSLQRKIVDIDYYAEMGCTAYSTLADSVKEDSVALVYKEYSTRFLDFVEVLSYISTNSFVQTEENILRLYETYSRTGSSLARDKLHELGVITIPVEESHKRRQ